MTTTLRNIQTASTNKFADRMCEFMCPGTPMSSTSSTSVAVLADTNALSQLTDTVKDSEEKKERAQYCLVEDLKLTSFSSL
jgi:hypothetical protein